MKVIKTGKMPNGTEIQIENWKDSYPSVYPFASTVASYPISKMTMPGTWAPKAGEKYRFSFNFESEQEAASAFSALLSGEKALSDYTDKMHDPKYADCV